MSAVGTTAVRRLVVGPLRANCYLLSVGRDAAIVDPGGAGMEIAERVASEGLRPHAVLATHGHHDHLGAAAELAELYAVPFGLHSADAGLLRRANFFRHALHALPSIEIPPVGLDLEGVAELRFGELEIAVAHTPGHSPGSVCFDLAGRLLTGDTLLADGAGRTDLPGSDSGTLEESIRGLSRGFPADTALYPGHGNAARLGEAVAAVAPEGGR